MTTKLRTGVLGLGAMGAPMARHLQAAGLLTVIWNRTESVARALAEELLVPVAADPAALARDCDVVLTCVSADADLESVLGQLEPGLSAGKVVLDTSTVSPGITRRLAAGLAEHGVDYVDAPVSGGVEGARAGTLSVMAGGNSTTLARIRPVLEAISARITHMGPVSSGQATKAVNQVIVGGLAEAVCEALALAERMELPAKPLLEVLSAGAAGSWVLDHRGATMLADEFTPGFKSGLLLKDLRICADLAQELHFPLPMVDATIRDYERLVAEGGAEDDTSALIRVKRDAHS